MPKMINEILLEIRKNHKFSRKGLSNLSGFKERTILSYERGENKPSDKYITFISLYFNVSEDFIRGGSEQKKMIDPLERVILMYKDIYGFDDSGMIEIFYNKNLDYVEILKSFYYKSSPDIWETLKIAKFLNIKPSSFGWNKSHEIWRKGYPMYFDSKEEHKLFLTKVIHQEEKGILLNEKYYAEMIKRRNLAKDNYTPVMEPKKLPKKHQDILDLLPYASDRFLEDIYQKLKRLKEIQSL